MEASTMMVIAACGSCVAAFLSVIVAIFMYCQNRKLAKDSEKLINSSISKIDTCLLQSANAQANAYKRSTLELVNAINAFPPIFRQLGIK